MNRLAHLVHDFLSDPRLPISDMEQTMWTHRIAAGAAALMLAACGTTGLAPGSSVQGTGVVQGIDTVPASDSGIGVGTIGGAVVGGLLGNQVGQGRGNTAATVAGTAAGALAGREIENRS